MRPSKGSLIAFSTLLRCFHIYYLSPVVCAGLYPPCLLTWLHSPSGLRFYWARITGFLIFMLPGVGHVNILLQSLRSWLEWVFFFSLMMIQSTVPVTPLLRWRNKEEHKWCPVCVTDRFLKERSGQGRSTVRLTNTPVNQLESAPTQPSDSTHTWEHAG